MLLRFLIYGAFGLCAEVIWTAVYDAVILIRQRVARHHSLRLEGKTYLWMFPIYGLCVLLFEPAHDLVRAWWVPGRLAIYVPAILLVEYVCGWLLRVALGRCPWDYGPTRWSLHGLIRLDYSPLWAVFSLLLERLHDALRLVV